MNEHYQAAIITATFLIGVPVGWWFANKVRKIRRTPRMLICHEPMVFDSAHPTGLNQVVNGVSVREDDVVFLTRQVFGYRNGFWKVNSKSWSRLNVSSEMTLVPSGDGHWVLATKEPEKKRTKVKRVSRYKRPWVI
jgi:hypothetical protein